MILEIMYLDFFRDKKSILSYIEGTELENLRKEQLGKLKEKRDKIICERLVEKHKKVKKSCDFKHKYFEKYGYPLESDENPDSEMISAMLLIKNTEIENVPSNKLKILEIQFFYSVLWLKNIMKITEMTKKIIELKKWYNISIPIIEKFFINKKMNNGDKEEFNNFFDINTFKAELMKGKIDYIESKYFNNKLFFEECYQFFDEFCDYKYYFKDTEMKYLLTKLIGVSVCPYCNRQYISVLEDEKKSTLTLDHYRREAEYPLLKLSIYNLVPSCYICNSILKGKNSLTHLNPWEDEDGGIKFTFKKINKNDDLLKNYYETHSCDTIQDTEVEVDISHCTEKAKNSLEVFKIPDIYKTHNTFVSELVAKAMKYEVCEYGNEIYNLLKKDKILTNKEQLDFYLYGDIIVEKDIHRIAKNKPLYKLEADIVNEIRGIKNDKNEGVSRYSKKNG